MGHLKSCRDGWQAEHLAKYLLGKFCFTSEPSTVSDDAGVDLFCTIFDIRDVGKYKQLFPRIPFAIQLKSHRQKMEFEIKDNKAINGLKIPYFVGKVDTSRTKIIIYGGESIKQFYHIKGENLTKPVYIKLVDFLELDAENQLKFYEENQEKYQIFFEKVIEITLDFNYETVEEKEKIKKFTDYCNILQTNIASIQNHEYFLHCSRGNPRTLRGRVSHQHFRKNLRKRFVEVIGNLDRGYDALDINNPIIQNIVREKELYEDIINRINTFYGKNQVTFTRVNGVGEIEMYLDDYIRDEI